MDPTRPPDDERGGVTMATNGDCGRAMLGGSLVSMRWWGAAVMALAIGCSGMATADDVDVAPSTNPHGAEPITVGLACHAWSWTGCYVALKCAGVEGVDAEAGPGRDRIDACRAASEAACCSGDECAAQSSFTLDGIIGCQLAMFYDQCPLDTPAECGALSYERLIR